MYIKTQKFLVLGVSKSGFSASNFLLDNGAKCYIYEEKFTFENKEYSLKGLIARVKLEEFENGQTLVILENLTEDIVIEEGQEITIDLNGKTITAKNDPNGDGLFMVVAGGDLTINGEGIVNDCPYAYIFSFLQSKPFRMKNTQRMLQYIEKNYRYLPFSGRWLTENFNEHRVNSGLKQLGDAMAIYPYTALKERTGAWVSQKEHTLIVESDGCNITTL